MKAKNNFFQKSASCLLLISFSLFFGNGKGYAQVQVINNGTSLINSTLIIVNGDVYHQNNGGIVNSGDIHITGDWTNNNSSNNVFTSGNDGWVHMEGTAQSIGGSNFTHFNNLELSGTGIKQLNNIDVEIEDTLALNDREFSAGDNTVLVQNTATGVVTRTNTMTGGFVSGTNDGGLMRNTASTNTYAFPVGSSVGTIRYRPVDLTPASASANTFKVRLANVNPTGDTYDVSQKDTSLCDVNTNYYHRIYQTAGSSAADVKIYYDATADGNYQTIAHWQNQPRWENTGGNTANNGSPFSDLSVNGWSDFTTNAFALAKLVPIASITTTASCKGEDAVFTAPSGFANYEFFVNGLSLQNGTNNLYSSNSLSNGDSVKVVIYDEITCQSTNNAVVPVEINPTPDVVASDNDTITLGESATLTATGANSYGWQPGSQSGASITVSPSEETTYTVIGTDANGCTDTSTVTLFIDATCVHLVPNVFSPNGDGQNENFKVLGKNLDWISLSVYDRWGNNVFETNDLTGKWDGAFKGALLNNGVFVYIMRGKCKNSNEEFEQHGNVTLTR